MGYVRFQMENMAELKQKAKSQQDLVTLVAAKWRNLSPEEKEKYNTQFQAEMVWSFTVLLIVFSLIYFQSFTSPNAQPEYKKQHAAYLKKLSAEQLQAIKAEQLKAKKNQAKAVEMKNRKKELLEEGKPKKPLSAYLLFSTAKSKETNKNASSLKSEWDNLSQDQQLAYKQKAQQLYDAYE